MTRSCFATALLLLLTLSACITDDTDDQTLGSFRAVVISDTWGLRDPERMPDVASCDDYWNDRCAGLSPSMCTIAKNRYTCTQDDYGVIITDNFGEATSAIAWDGVALDSDSPSTGNSAGAACQGLNPETCVTLAKVADLVASRSTKLVQAFPRGGFASLTIRDDILRVEPLHEASEDLTLAFADKFEWRVPLIEGEYSLGKADGLVLDEPVVLTIRPNGTISLSNFELALMQRMKKPKSNFNTNMATYSMSSWGANYNHSYIFVVGGWERYAAQWKAYVDALVGTVDLMHAYTGGNSTPLVGAEANLEHNEANYFTDTWGNHYDPNGTWMSEDIDDPLTGLAFAAMVMHYWHSPVFFNGAWEPSLQIAPTHSWYQEFALERITFELPNAPDLHSACGISPTASAVSALAAIQTCNLSGLTIHDAVVTAWLGDFSNGLAPDLLHHQVISGTELMSTYAAGLSVPPNYWPGLPNGWSSGHVGELVFDPPAEAGDDEIAAVRALADILADEIRDQVPMEQLFE